MPVPSQHHISWSFCGQLFEVNGGLFCWYWWNCWPSLFQLSFSFHKLLCQKETTLVWMFRDKIYDIWADQKFNMAIRATNVIWLAEILSCFDFNVVWIMLFWWAYTRYGYFVSVEWKSRLSSPQNTRKNFIAFSQKFYTQSNPNCTWSLDGTLQSFLFYLYWNPRLPLLQYRV